MFSVYTAIFFGITFAAPQDRPLTSDGASEGWFGSSEVFVYKYIANVEVGQISGKANSNGFVLDCSLEIHPLPGYQRLLKVPRCQYKDDKEDGMWHDFSAQVNRNNVQFSTAGGLMSNVIYAASNEDTEVLNIKRGILSLLQFPIDTLTSVRLNTVRGSCLSYISDEDGTMTSKIDVGECSSPWMPDQAMPFAKVRHTMDTVVHPRNASLQCVTVLDDENKLSGVNCKETFIFPSLNPHAKSAVLTTKQFLELKETRQSSNINLASPLDKVTTLAFEQPAITSSSTNVADVRQSLQDVLVSSYPQVTSQAAQKFAESVSLLRQLHSGKMHQLQRLVRGCNRDCDPPRQKALVTLFEDALVACGTKTCQHTIAKVLGSVTKERAGAFLMAMAASGIPDRVTLKHTIKYCKTIEGASCILPMSIMVHNFYNNLDAETDQNLVWESIALLKKVLGNDCRNGDDSTTDHLIITLMGIANMGKDVIKDFDEKQNGIAAKIIPVVRQCVSNRAVHQRVAIQALQTLETVDMTEEVQRSLLAILGYSAFPVELRSSIFDVLLRHGSQKMVSDVVHFMLREEVLQMRAYMTSYVSKILKTNDTSRLKLRDYIKRSLEDHGQHVLLVPEGKPGQDLSFYQLLVGEADTDSRVHQHLERSVVYSPSSILPSTETFKLSLEVLGQEIPVFNIGAFQEGFMTGLDLVGNSLFGSSDDGDSDFSHFHSLIVSQLEQLHDSVHHAQNHPSAALHMRLMGYNIALLSLDDLHFLSSLKHMTSQEDLWSLLSLDTLITRLTDDISWSRNKALHLTLVNEVIPTSLGLPISLALDGTLVIAGNFQGTWQDDAKPAIVEDMNAFHLTGSLEFGATGEMVTSISIGLSGQTLVGIKHKKSLQLNLDNPFSLKSDSRGLQLRIDRVSNMQDSILYRSSTELQSIESGNQVLASSEASQECFWTYLQSVTGWRLCSNTVSISSSVKMAARMLWDAIPPQLTGILEKMITLTQQSLIIQLPLPKSSGSVQATGWFSYLQSVWSDIRRSATAVPPAYTALVFNNRHIYTFDGQYYSLPDEVEENCAYVLCRDFVSRNFTVLMSHTGITILTRDIAISIDQQGQVKVNNTDDTVDVPLQTWNEYVSVIRQGRAIVVNTTYGLHARCVPGDAQFCILSVEGWYHNRTLGLLGTNDNEVTNDFRKRDGQTADDLQDFLNSFEVSGLSQCRPSGVTISAQANNRCPTEESRRCLNIFDRQLSALAPCFSLIDPKPFQEACEKATSECGVRSDSSVACTMAREYMTICYAKGITVTVPAGCSSCISQPLSLPWEETGHRLADIVLVASLNQDMSEVRHIGHSLRNFLYTLRQQLKRNDISDVRIALLGHGGSGFYDQPHLLTTNSKEFNDLIRDHQVLRQLDNLESSGTSPASVNEALLLTAMLPFRPKAVRSVIIMSNQVSQLNADDQDHIRQMLEANDITLNIMSSYRSIVGVRWDGQLVGTEGTMSTSIFDQNRLAELVKGTQGSLFNLGSALHGGTQVTRQIARALVDQIKSQSSNCRQCHCSSDQFASVLSQCRRLPCS